MSYSSYQWRADGGYLPPSGYQPAPFFHGMPPPPTYVAAPVFGPAGYIPVPPRAMVPRYVAPPPAYSRPSPPPAQNAVARTASRWTNPNRPPTLRPGMNYMFSPEYTHLHIFGKTAKIWKDRYHGQAHKFKQFKTPTTMTVQNIISNVLSNKNPEYCKDWAVTEVKALGDGRWDKGMQIPFSSDRAKKTLESVGWDNTRGVSREPVWLVVHKI